MGKSVAACWLAPGSDWVWHRKPFYSFWFVLDCAVWIRGQKYIHLQDPESGNAAQWHHTSDIFIRQSIKLLCNIKKCQWCHWHACTLCLCMSACNYAVSLCLFESADLKLTSPDYWKSEGLWLQSVLSLKRLLVCGGHKQERRNLNHIIIHWKTVMSFPRSNTLVFFSRFSISLVPHWSLWIVVSLWWSLTKQWLLAQVSAAYAGFPGFLLYLIAHHICDKWCQKPQWREIQLSKIYWLQRHS